MTLCLKIEIETKMVNGKEKKILLQNTHREIDRLGELRKRNHTVQTTPRQKKNAATTTIWYK